MFSCYSDVSWLNSPIVVEVYPLVVTNIAIENGDWWWIYPLKIVIFHSYVELPEGTYRSAFYLMILNQFSLFHSLRQPQPSKHRGGDHHCDADFGGFRDCTSSVQGRDWRTGSSDPTLHHGHGHAESETWTFLQPHHFCGLISNFAQFFVYIDILI